MISLKLFTLACLIAVATCKPADDSKAGAAGGDVTRPDRYSPKYAVVSQRGGGGAEAGKLNKGLLEGGAGNGAVTNYVKSGGQNSSSNDNSGGKYDKLMNYNLTYKNLDNP
ncbi:uncharacterized protein isoform X1 [Choristoneura fumiferana]|uniref:uncharacterized protein isoform X1 n=1 Tax=Choristoneura fumiferana TaxID=7141 RepID=UPI003D154855